MLVIGVLISNWVIVRIGLLTIVLPIFSFLHNEKNVTYSQKKHPRSKRRIGNVHLIPLAHLQETDHAKENLMCHVAPEDS